MKNRLMWFLPAIALIILFCSYTPEFIIGDLPTVISFIKGIICSIFIFGGICNFDSFLDLMYMKNVENEAIYDKYKSNGGVGMAVCGFLIVPLTILFSKRQDVLNQEIFVENGIKVTGIITGMNFKTSNRGSFEHLINVEFENNKGQEIKTNIYVPDSLWTKSRLNQKIHLLYLPEYPNKATFVLREKLNFLSYDEFDRIYNASSNDILGILHSISEDWNSGITVDNVLEWKNMVNGESIFRSPENRLIYISRNVRANFTKEMGITSIETNSTGTIFHSTKYTIYGKSSPQSNEILKNTSTNTETPIIDSYNVITFKKN